jgi:hypothetical protein
MFGNLSIRYSAIGQTPGAFGPYNAAFSRSNSLTLVPITFCAEKLQVKANLLTTPCAYHQTSSSGISKNTGIYQGKTRLSGRVNKNVMGNSG